MAAIECTRNATLPDMWRDTFRARQVALGHANAIIRTESALNHWTVFAGSELPLATITEDLVYKFQAWLIQSGLGRNTARHYVGALRTLLRDIDPSICPDRQRTTVHQVAESGGDIWAHLERYLSAREVSASYAAQLRHALAMLERFHGSDLDLSDLHPELLNAWLTDAAKRGLSDETRRSRRRMALTLWRDAADLGLVAPPRRVMRVSQRDRINTAWNLEDMTRLLSACDQLTKFYSHGISKRLYWRSYIMTAWDSGLRGCDLRRLMRTGIRTDGCVTIIQHKTGRRLRCRLRPETVTAINATFPPARELCFPMWGRLEAWRREAARLLRLSGLAGSIGQLRHSSGTAVEHDHPGHGHEHLGNTRAVFERHYLDLDQVAFDRPLPPAIGEKGGEE
jgi:hypothetical protein